MKPLQKVVTAQDIESSLYYVHVDGAGDEELREMLLREQDHRISNGEADGNTFGGHTPHGSRNGIARKPLPSSPQLALGNRPEPPPKVYPHYQPPANGVRGNTQYGRQSAGYGASSGGANLDEPSMRHAQNLLGPRPMHQRLRSVDSAALGAVPERQNVNLRRWSEQPTTSGPRLPPRPHIRRKEVYSNGFPRSSELDSPTLPPRPRISRKEVVQNRASRYSENSLQVPEIVASNGHQLEAENTSLTLIRRYGGLQWNVGRISSNLDSAMDDSGGARSIQSDPDDDHLNGGMSIEISTAGYSRFGDHSLQIDQPKTSFGSSPNYETLATRDATVEQAVFRRQLQAFRDETRPELRRTPSSATSSNSRDSRPSFNFRKLSHQSDNNIKTENAALLTSKPPKLKHYSFLSPWNGTCDFDVGVLGRSIKCKHTLQNPRAASRSIQVSELRFNLPSSKVLGPSPKSPSPSRNSGTPRESKRSSFFSSTAHHHPRISPHLERYDSRDYLDEHYFGADEDGKEERMDLSLGQELAGGGFGGKQAKLGKLIVEAEGLKMLDLVVAANVGIWWKVYGRVV